MFYVTLVCSVSLDLNFNREQVFQNVHIFGKIKPTLPLNIQNQFQKRFLPMESMPLVSTMDHSKICNAFHVLLISSMANLMLNPFSSYHQSPHLVGFYCIICRTRIVFVNGNTKCRAHIETEERKER